jgi:hypothetical protein
MRAAPIAAEQLYGPFDRRRRRRYPVALTLRWHLGRGQLSGTGSTLDMTSRALAFRTEGIAPRMGSYLEVSVAWPVPLNDTCPLKFMVWGSVLRSEPGRTVISIERHEFRTAGGPLAKVG